MKSGARGRLRRFFGFSGTALRDIDTEKQDDADGNSDPRACLERHRGDARTLSRHALQLNDHLSRRFGAEIWLKREDLSPVRSYKIRGAFNFFRKVIARGEGNTTFVCASAGNHAQGFAYVCRHFGVQGVVFMPVTTPQQKIDKTRMFGGEFIKIPADRDFFDQCYAAARTHAEETKAIWCRPSTMRTH